MFLKLAPNQSISTAITSNSMVAIIVGPMFWFKHAQMLFLSYISVNIYSEIEYLSTQLRRSVHSIQRVIDRISYAVTGIHFLCIITNWIHWIDQKVVRLLKKQYLSVLHMLPYIILVQNTHSIPSILYYTY